MTLDSPARELFAELCRIPLIDPHSHINPHAPASHNLDDILGYHYYTELAHSAGMPKDCLAPDFPPRERVRTLLGWMDRLENTVQYSWLLDIARTFLGFQGDRLQACHTDWLWDTAERLMASPDWEKTVLQRSGIEKVFLTNDFDDPLSGFDASRYIPCLRTDDLVFHLDKPAVRQRLARATDIARLTPAGIRQALGKLFEHFTRRGARACAISLPPDFHPEPIPEADLEKALAELAHSGEAGCSDAAAKRLSAAGLFWMLAEFCQDFHLPFDLMIGVNRRVYPGGVFQGQDLFDQRTSLIQYARLFNAFPEVTFCISVLTSAQNQELTSYAWIFPNVVTSGHWWYSNLPVFVEQDLRARLQAVPGTKQIGYYSDMYKLEFGLPKFNMYRRVLARVLAQDFIRERGWSESQALALGRLILRDNVERIFDVG